MYDYVIKNGLIFDGTGKAPYTASICIEKGRIASIVEDYKRGATTIDVSGLAVAPGFIDIHAHSDICPLVSDLSESKVYQGVTTELVGNCGISAIPCSRDNKEQVKKYMSEHFQSICKDITWEAYSMADFAKTLENVKKSINWASLIGHGTLRACVMGFDNRKATKEEIEKMKKLLDQEIKAGAFGMSLGLIYPPGSFSDIDELVELAKVVKDNNTILTSHIRGESDTIFKAIEEMIEVARRSRVHMHISHLKLMGKTQWGQADKLLEIIKNGRKEGLNITCDQYPYIASSTSLAALVPKWAHEGGTDNMVSRLYGPEGRKVKEGILTEMNKRGGASRVTIASTYGQFPQIDGKSIAEISKALNMKDEETVAKILIECNGTVAAIYYSMNEEDLIRIMKEKEIAIGSDGYAFSLDKEKVAGKPHPRSFGTFPRFLKIVRENKMISLEDAIYKITGLSAKLIGLKERGVIKENYIADLVVFDPDNIEDTSTFENPFLKPKGIKYVFVSGKPVVFDEEQTKERNGKIILKK